MNLNTIVLNADIAIEIAKTVTGVELIKKKVSCNMENKFYFIPFRRQNSNRDKEPYAKIFSNGLLVINERSFNALGYELDKTLYSIFCDADKRAIGFKFGNKTDIVKQIEIARKASYGKNMFSFKTGVKSFLSQIGGAELPTDRLPIKSYTDNDEYTKFGKIFYVTIPKYKKKK